MFLIVLVRSPAGQPQTRAAQEIRDRPPSWQRGVAARCNGGSNFERRCEGRTAFPVSA
jgi:hypothetical protein